MYIYLIIARVEGDPPWIVAAWDEWTVEENPDGYQKDLKKAKEKYGKEVDVREALVKVSDDFLKRAFEPHVEEAKEE